MPGTEEMRCESSIGGPLPWLAHRHGSGVSVRGRRRMFLGATLILCTAELVLSPVSSAQVAIRGSATTRPDSVTVLLDAAVATRRAAPLEGRAALTENRRARSLAQRALVLARARGDRPRELDALRTFAWLAWLDHALDSVLHYDLLALAVARQIGDSGVVLEQESHIADAYADANRLDSARVIHTRVVAALRARGADRALVHELLDFAATEATLRPDTALALVAQILAHPPPRQDSASVEGIGAVTSLAIQAVVPPLVERGRAHDALPYLRLFSAVCRLYDPSLAPEADTLLANGLARDQQIDSALVHYRSALAAYEQQDDWMQAQAVLPSMLAIESERVPTDTVLRHLKLLAAAQRESGGAGLAQTRQRIAVLYESMGVSDSTTAYLVQAALAAPIEPARRGAAVARVREIGIPLLRIEQHRQCHSVHAVSYGGLPRCRGSR